MKRTTAFLAALIVLAAGSAAYALYEVADEGLWPKSWPQELEPFRAHSRTLEGPLVSLLHYEIPFTDREQFEAAWPHLLKVKSDGAPVFLVRTPMVNVYDLKSGVIIHSPPEATDRSANPDRPLGGDKRDPQTWMWTTYIELVVDGEVVDLNRIPLPSDTPIIDRRFDDRANLSPARAGG